ncbi:hypothetical protein AB0A94_00590 [Streptomyces sp. NPDC044984]|uniref:hypothetical protein n=1 Tax=Streptomyces sp. NPDC044984 TaxID=3154335 RepID=UPI0033C88D8C
MNVAEVTERLPAPSRPGAPVALRPAGGIDAGADDWINGWIDDSINGWSGGWIDDWINGWIDGRGGSRGGGRIAASGLRERVHTSTSRS